MSSVPSPDVFTNVTERDHILFAKIEFNTSPWTDTDIENRDFV